MFKKLICCLPLVACTDSATVTHEVIEQKQCYPKENHQDETCNRVHLSYPKYAEAWLNALIERHILAQLVMHKDDDADAPIAQTVQDAAKNLVTIKNNEPSLASEYNIQMLIYGETPDFLSLVTYTDYYQMGMAHGLPGKFPLLIDKNKKQVLQIRDILLDPSQESLLWQQQKEAWIQTLSQPNQQYLETLTEPAARTFVQEWGFEPSKDWRIGKGGLIFQFQPYQLCAYACGMPEVFLAADKLQNLIKPEILKASETWQDRPDIEEALQAPEYG